MSDTWINIRLFVWHIQAKLGSLTKWTVSYNDYWAKFRWLKSPIGLYQCDIKLGWKRRKDGLNFNVNGG